MKPLSNPVPFPVPLPPTINSLLLLLVADDDDDEEEVEAFMDDMEAEEK